MIARKFHIFLIASMLFSTALVRADEFPRTTKPVLVWTDTNSKITKPLFARCDTRKEWSTVWQKHQGRDADPYMSIAPYPEIDFESYMAIAIFHGKSSMNSGIWVREVVEEKSRIRIHYQPSWYQIVVDTQTNAREALAETNSFAFILLPRSRKEIVFEEDVRRTIQGPSVWKERARIAGR